LFCTLCKSFFFSLVLRSACLYVGVVPPFPPPQPSWFFSVPLFPTSPPIPSGLDFSSPFFCPGSQTFLQQSRPPLHFLAHFFTPIFPSFFPLLREFPQNRLFSHPWSQPPRCLSGPLFVPRLSSSNYRGDSVLHLFPTRGCLF